MDPTNSSWQCDAAVDLAFILDASGSIFSYYQDYISLIKKVVDHFPISESGTRIALLLFSNDKIHSVGLNEHETSSSFLEGLKNLPEPMGNSRISYALEASYKSLYENSDPRTNVPKVMVVLSDGFYISTPSDGKTPEQAADEMESYGVKVIDQISFFFTEPNYPSWHTTLEQRRFDVASASMQRRIAY